MPNRITTEVLDSRYCFLVLALVERMRYGTRGCIDIWPGDCGFRESLIALLGICREADVSRAENAKK